MKKKEPSPDQSKELERPEVTRSQIELAKPDSKWVRAADFQSLKYESFKQKTKISDLRQIIDIAKSQIEELTLNSYDPHEDADTIEIIQYDEKGEKVAHSTITNIRATSKQ